MIYMLLYCVVVFVLLLLLLLLLQFEQISVEQIQTYFVQSEFDFLSFLFVVYVSVLCMYMCACIYETTAFNQLINYKLIVSLSCLAASTTKRNKLAFCVLCYLSLYSFSTYSFICCCFFFGIHLLKTNCISK